jgi:hypothetical protein
VARRGRWQPGESGNPRGRPIGARHRFSEVFVNDIAATWEAHGAGILEKMATCEPARFAELCGRLTPRDVSLSLQTSLPGGIDPADWAIAQEVFAAIKQAMPSAGERARSLYAQSSSLHDPAKYRFDRSMSRSKKIGFRLKGMAWSSGEA